MDGRAGTQVAVAIAVRCTLTLTVGFAEGVRFTEAVWFARGQPLAVRLALRILSPMRWWPYNPANCPSMTTAARAISTNAAHPTTVARAPLR